MPKAPRSIPKRKRHKKWLKRARGYRGRRSTIFKQAKEAVLKAGQHAYHDRRKKKGQFRSLWQVRINAAARQHDMSYSKLMAELKKNNVQLNRKMLATLATDYPETFKQVVSQVKPETPTKDVKS